MYDRFEAPDLDDGDVEDDDIEEGYRTVSFSDLVEPRLVQYSLRNALENEDGIPPSTIRDSQGIGFAGSLHVDAGDDQAIGNAKKSTTPGQDDSVTTPEGVGKLIAEKP